MTDAQRMLIRSIYLAGVAATIFNPAARWRWDKLFPEWARRG